MVFPKAFATPIPIITIPLETAIQGRNFAIPIPSEEIAIPVNPKVATKAAVTIMPTNPPLVSLLMSSREVSYACPTKYRPRGILL